MITNQLIGLVTQTDMVNAYVQMLERQDELESENQHLHVLSNQDPLMKIGNRRAMDVELSFVEAASRRYGKSYAIALMDVDLFKSITTTMANQQGDKAFKGSWQKRSRAACGKPTGSIATVEKSCCC